MDLATKSENNASAVHLDLPKLRHNSALFLDLDGTLLEIAPEPDAVVVPAGLVPLLARLSEWLKGALAIISGRSLQKIDALLSPLVLPAAGEHGAVIRLPGGLFEENAAAGAIPDAWRERIDAAASKWKSVVVEHKAHGTAIHFRKKPELERRVRTLVESLIKGDQRDFKLLEAKLAFEICARSTSKAFPVRRFMRLPPFEGRLPVFVGDDVTDEDGFLAALELGGTAVNVHKVFHGKPAEVLAWLDAAMGR